MKLEEFDRGAVLSSSVRYNNIEFVFCELMHFFEYDSINGDAGLFPLMSASEPNSRGNPKTS